MERAARIGGVEDAQKRRGRARKRGAVISGKESRRGVGTACAGREHQTAEQQAHDEKAGGEPLPRASAKKASVPSVH